MMPCGTRTWKWLARKEMGLPSVPVLGRGGHRNSTCCTAGGENISPPTADVPKGVVGGGCSVWVMGLVTGGGGTSDVHMGGEGVR